VHDEALLCPGEDPEQAPVLLGVGDAEVGEGLHHTGSTALRLLPAALLREHFVSHVYMVPHATDKTGLWARRHGEHTIFVSRSRCRRPETCRIERLTGK